MRLGSFSSFFSVSLKEFRFASLTALIFLRLFLWAFYLDTPIPFGPISDSWVYLNCAQEWLQTGSWPVEAAYHPPLYSYIIALILKISSGSILWVLILQNVVGVLVSQLILEWLWKSKPSGLRVWIGLVLILQSSAWFVFEWRLFPESLAIACEVLFLHLAWKLKEGKELTKKTHFYSILCAVTASLLVLLRPNFILILPLMWLWVLLALRKLRRRYFVLATWVILPVLCILPILVRNARLGVGYSLTANSGITFYQGNNPSAKGNFNSAGISTDVVLQNEYAVKVAGQKNPNMFWWKKGIDYLVGHPIDAFYLWGMKVWRWILPIEPESGSDLSLAFQKIQVPFLHLVSLANFFVLLLCGVLGTIVSRKYGPPLFLQLGLVGITFFTCLVFFVSHRYRAMAWPLLIYPASIGLEAVIKSLRKESLFETKISPFVAGTVLGAIVISSLISFIQPASNTSEADGWHNWGVAWMHAGQIKEAEAAFGKVSEFNPRHQPTLENLAGIYLYQNDLEKASKVLEELIKKFPHSSTGHNNLAVLFMRNGKWREAQKEAEKALEFRPENESAKINFTLASFRAGDFNRTCMVFRQIRQKVIHRPDFILIAAKCDRTE